MARKNILESMMSKKPASAEPAAAAAPAPMPARPRSSMGAIGAVSQSISDLKARAMIEIDPFAIEGAGLTDRLSDVSEEDALLRASLSEYGQQVPILVRPHPTAAGKYQIVYGRRRVLAMRDIGGTVKALVRDLDDRDLIIAQGQENTARRDLSFIEKANFARQMLEQGFERKVICDTLSIDKTLISRLLAVAEAVPISLIHKIGAAHGIGRERWLAMAELCRKARAAGLPETEAAIVANGETSDARFDAAFAYLTSPKAALVAPKEKAKPALILDATGAPLAQHLRNARSLKFENTDFADWIAEALPALHADWLKRNP